LFNLLDVTLFVLLALMNPKILAYPVKVQLSTIQPLTHVNVHQDTISNQLHLVFDLLAQFVHHVLCPAKIATIIMMFHAPNVNAISL